MTAVTVVGGRISMLMVKSHFGVEEFTKLISPYESVLTGATIDRIEICWAEVFAEMLQKANSKRRIRPAVPLDSCREGLIVFFPL